MVKRAGAWNWSWMCIRPRIGSNTTYIKKAMPAIFSRGWKVGWRTSTRERTNEGFPGCCVFRYVFMVVWIEGGSYMGRWFGRVLTGMVVTGGSVVHVSMRQSRYSFVRLTHSWSSCSRMCGLGLSKVVSSGGRDWVWRTGGEMVWTW